MLTRIFAFITLKIVSRKSYQVTLYDFHDFIKGL